VAPFASNGQRHDFSPTGIGSRTDEGFASEAGLGPVRRHVPMLGMIVDLRCPGGNLHPPTPSDLGNLIHQEACSKPPRIPSAEPPA